MSETTTTVKKKGGPGRPRGSEIRTRIEAAFLREPIWSAAKLAKEVESSKQTVRHHLLKLADEGRISAISTTEGAFIEVAALDRMRGQPMRFFVVEEAKGEGGESDGADDGADDFDFDFGNQGWGQEVEPVSTASDIMGMWSGNLIDDPSEDEDAPEDDEPPAKDAAGLVTIL